jgi:hypothetical protein
MMNHRLISRLLLEETFLVRSMLLFSKIEPHTHAVFCLPGSTFTNTNRRACTVVVHDFGACVVPYAIWTFLDAAVLATFAVMIVIVIEISTWNTIATTTLFTIRSSRTSER